MLDGISFAIFAIPSAAMIAVWWGFVASWRSEKGRMLALPGLVVTSITACIAIGGTWKSWGTPAFAVWMALAWTAACATL